jgi:hypothetical protein
MAFAHGSKGRLTTKDAGRFAGTTLFNRIGRAVCEAGCLPRKELYEAWEIARRVRRLFRGGRVVDLAAGHGLLAHLMLLLDDTSPSALAADPKFPPSAVKLHAMLVKAWPRLAHRVEFIERPIDDVAILETDVVVSSHPCGALTDDVLGRAMLARARVAVLPCCHDFDRNDAAGLQGWLDQAAAIDVARAMRLQASGYRIWTQTIPERITPRNRLLIGMPDDVRF